MYSAPMYANVTENLQYNCTVVIGANIRKIVERNGFLIPASYSCNIPESKN